MATQSELTSEDIMDLVMLWEGVPALLEACVHANGPDEPLTIRNFRLISKESSRIALTAVTSYCLNLMGRLGEDTNISGARLLRQTRLNTLIVNVSLNESFSPAVLVDAFVKEVGNALATVHSLSLAVNNTHRFAVTTAVLEEALVLLVQACPALKALHYWTESAPTMLAAIGKAFPQLWELDVFSEDNDGITCVRNILQQQPILFPHLHILNLAECGEELPDMSHRLSICTLTLPQFTFASRDQWRFLPPNLQHLQVQGFDTGPPTLNNPISGRHRLAGLLHVGILYAVVPLNALAPLLRAALALNKVTVGDLPSTDKDAHACEDIDWEYIVVDCTQSMSTSEAMALDLATVRERMCLDSIVNAAYLFDCSQKAPWGSLLPLIAALPPMRGFSSCMLACCDHAQLEQLLRCFPNVTTLVLAHLDLDDAQLVPLLTRMGNLTKLRLHKCSNFSSTGLAALCCQLPGLCYVRCEGCDRLKTADLELCKKVVMRDITMTKREPYPDFQLYPME